MSRELRRVPLDFDWPIGQTWSGYINLHYEAHRRDCQKCAATGYSALGRRLSDQWSGKAPFDPSESGSHPFLATHPSIQARAKRRAPNAIEAQAQRLAAQINRSLAHHLNQDDVNALLAGCRLREFRGREVPPTAREVNELSLSTPLHDEVSKLLVIQSRCKRAGESELCDECLGEGSVLDSVDAKRLSEEWQPTDPPTGEGYQVWETVYEGTPISPVFATADELAAWMAANGTGTDRGTTKQQWLTFITAGGHAPSFVVRSTANGIEVKTGVQASSERPSPRQEGTSEMGHPNSK